MTTKKISRREFLKLQGLAAGGLALAGSGALPAARAAGACQTGEPCFDHNAPDQVNSLFDGLPTACINEPLADDEMRITFLGTSCTPMLTQQGVSVYVEVGPTHVVVDTVGNTYHTPKDYAMFDCGMGCMTNYIAAGIPYSRMDKIFIAHLHADHMSDLSSIYCFGESADRKSPLYVWGPGKSYIPDPVVPGNYIHEDGIREAMEHFRALWRWHTESFSFASNGYSNSLDPMPGWGLPAGVDLTPVGKYSQYKDPPKDAYALIPIELDWTRYGKKKGDNIAYWNKDSGVKITHFPVVHCRKGSIGYKLEFTPPGHPEKAVSMIYSSDTRPNTIMIDQARGIDVLVHEIVMPPAAWTAKFAHLPVGTIPASDYFTNVQNSSHTSQAAFGYLLSQINPRPRLAVATHFQATDDTIASARQSLDAFCIPHEAYTFALDFMVFNVTRDKITQRRLDVSRYAFPYGPGSQYGGTKEFALSPKYHKPGQPAAGDPEAQIDLTNVIQPSDKTYTKDGYWPGEDFKPQCQK